MVLPNHQVDMELLGVGTEGVEVVVMEVVDLVMVLQILVMDLLIPATALLLVRSLFS